MHGFEAEGEFVLFPIHLLDGHINLLPDCKDSVDILNATPRNLRDRDQAFQCPDIHKSSEFLNGHNFAADGHPLMQNIAKGILLFLPFRFQDGPVGNNDVAPFFTIFDDPERQMPVNIPARIFHPTQPHLRIRAKSTDVAGNSDGEPSLDFLFYTPLKGDAAVIGLFQVFRPCSVISDPGGKYHVVVTETQKKDVDRISLLDGKVAFIIHEFLHNHTTVRLAPYIDKSPLFRDLGYHHRNLLPGSKVNRLTHGPV